MSEDQLEQFKRREVKLKEREAKHRERIIKRLNSLDPETFKMEELKTRETAYLEAAEDLIEKMEKNQMPEAKPGEVGFFQGKVDNQAAKTKGEKKTDKKKNKQAKRDNATILVSFDRRYRSNASVNSRINSPKDTNGGQILRLYNSPWDQIGRLL